MFRAFLIYLPNLHGNHEQRSLSSGSDRSRQSRSIGERRIDGRMPLLLTGSPPLLEKVWQFAKAPKTKYRACYRTKRRADQDRSGPESGCPIKSISAVIDDQR